LTYCTLKTPKIKAQSKITANTNPYITNQHNKMLNPKSWAGHLNSANFNFC
jgi:hypothetical protein